MKNQINPFIGVWMADSKDDISSTVSHIQFTDKLFFYYVILFNEEGKEYSRVLYKGTYTYNENSSIIFFEIEEPVSDAGITSSSYQFHEDKLYCYGSKIFITEKLHSKVDASKYMPN